MARPLTETWSQPRTIITGKHLGYLTLALVSIGAGVGAVLLNPVVMFGLVGVTVMAAVLLAFPYVGMLVYLVFEYANLPAMFPALQALQIGKLIAVPTLAIWLIRYVFLRDVEFVRERAYGLMAAWLLLALASISWAGSSQAAFQATVDLLKWLTISFLILNLVNTLPKYQIFVWLLLLLNFKLSQHQLRSFAYAMHHTTNQTFLIQDGVGAGSVKFFANATDFGLAMVIVVPLAFYAAKAARAWYLKVGAAGMAAAFTMSILRSGSRGAALALFAMAVLYWWRSEKKLMPALAVVGFILAFWAVAPDAWQNRFEKAKDYQEDGTAMQRIHLWDAGFQMFVRNPIMGVGMNNFTPEFTAHYMPGGYIGAYAPHSIWIQAGAELGVPGLVILGGILLLIFRRNSQTREICRRANLDEPWLINMSKAVDLCNLGFIVGGTFLTVLYFPHLFIILPLSLSLHHIALKKVREQSVAVTPDG